ncbi:methionyl-tRNA formyltransferase [Candidatus Palauibacter sp.]|uniref:methionyl-tRNA formyltransferase n=1 Tax=Candidatus Palauibacter sp. TaxID=3101350 RepID=UPI003AF28EF3
MRVLFWGTPGFGLPSLEAMRAAGHEVVGVVTNPDRPSGRGRAGRGRALRASPVKEWALAAEVPVLQPVRPGEAAFLDAARRLAPDVSVVAAYGRILPREALDLPPLGSFNVHASLLPALRGAAPINWAIICGHAESGVSIQRMVAALDAGPVLGRTRIPIHPVMTAGELYEAASAAAGARLVTVLADLAAGRAVETPQDETRVTWAPKLDREAARIDWSRSAAELDRWLRGCDPWPAAWTTLRGRSLQCFEPTVEPDAPGAGDPATTAGAPAPGTVIEAHPVRGLRVATGDGVLRVGAVKPAGRRRMSAAAWARGVADLKEVRFD